MAKKEKTIEINDATVQQAAGVTGGLLGFYLAKNAGKPHIPGVLLGTFIGGVLGTIFINQSK